MYISIYIYIYLKAYLTSVSFDVVWTNAAWRWRYGERALLTQYCCTCIKSNKASGSSIMCGKSSGVMKSPN